MRVTTPPSWSLEDTRRAKEAWKQYQTSHDISSEVGRTVGIDPQTGEVWIADDIVAVVNAAQEAGSGRPLLFLRVGSEYTFRKGGSTRTRRSGHSHA
jgi:hypothetical protein